MSNQIEILEDRLTHYIKIFSTENARMFKGVRYYKTAIVFFSAASAITLGLQLGDSPDIIKLQKNIALIIGAVITALATLSAFWNVEEYWLQSTFVHKTLERLKDRVDFEKANGITDQRVSELFDDLESIIELNQRYWKRALQNARSNTVK